MTQSTRSLTETTIRSILCELGYKIESTFEIMANDLIGVTVDRSAAKTIFTRRVEHLKNLGVEVLNFDGFMNHLFTSRAAYFDIYHVRCGEEQVVLFFEGGKLLTYFSYKIEDAIRGS